ncbi:MAG: bifunctional 2-polyprenyl-6-hydroxyphenol methylase/3-demethylubiquinol 3-O-methyltransferase UbiG [Gammaproteobacteria bacterium]
MSQQSVNADPGELNKFSAMAYQWWDPDGEFKPLHAMNPLRVRFIDERAPLAGKRVLDVGCGGGLLAEAMSRYGAEVTGIDLVPDSLEVARLHALESGVKVDYREQSAESLADEETEGFDIITCLEMLEHVPEPGGIIEACSRLLKPGGQIFFSTINRTPKAYALAIVAAEYIMGMLAKGTHDYKKFIRPAELGRWSEEAGLTLQEVQGIIYNPLNRKFRLSETDVDVNYIVHAHKPA